MENKRDYHNVAINKIIFRIEDITSRVHELGEDLQVVSVELDRIKEEALKDIK